jgi:hypothetical protein
MNRSRDNRSRRMLLFMAVLFGAIFTTMVLPAYGQQDVDPTWYDPYAVNAAPNPAPPPVAIHSLPLPVLIHRHQTTLTSTSLSQSQGAEKSRAKQSTATPKIRAVRILGNPKKEEEKEEEVRQIARRRDHPDQSSRFHP